MSNKVFVGGLSWNIDNPSLDRAFSRFGRVVEAKVRARGCWWGQGNARLAPWQPCRPAATTLDCWAPCSLSGISQVIIDRETGKSKGFGFVTFEPNARDAVPDSIREMNESELDGRRINVREATEQHGRGGAAGGGGQGGQQQQQQQHQQQQQQQQQQQERGGGGSYDGGPRRESYGNHGDGNHRDGGGPGRDGGGPGRERWEEQPGRRDDRMAPNANRREYDGGLIALPHTPPRLLASLRLQCAATRSLTAPVRTPRAGRSNQSDRRGDPRRGDEMNYRQGKLADPGGALSDSRILTI